LIKRSSGKREFVPVEDCRPMLDKYGQTPARKLTPTNRYGQGGENCAKTTTNRADKVWQNSPWDSTPQLKKRNASSDDSGALSKKPRSGLTPKVTTLVSSNPTRPVALFRGRIKTEPSPRNPLVRLSTVSKPLAVLRVVRRIEPEPWPRIPPPQPSATMTLLRQNRVWWLQPLQLY
jgi:hypothetical protein